MAKRSLVGLRVAITGASQGIGRAMALDAAHRGAKVVAAARNPGELGKLAVEAKSRGGLVIPVVADVTKPDDRHAILDAAQAQFGGLDVLVNNAGIGATGHLMECQFDTLRSIFETNYFAAVELTRDALPVLRAGTTPAVLMVSSVLGKRGWPARGHYSASKFALQAFADELRRELTPDKIDVIVVSPGLTQTNFSHNMLERSARIPLDHLRGMSSESVAAATLNALESGQRDMVLTSRGKLLVTMDKIAPWVIDYFGKRKIRQLFADEIAVRRAG